MTGGQFHADLVDRYEDRMADVERALADAVDTEISASDVLLADETTSLADLAGIDDGLEAIQEDLDALDYDCELLDGPVHLDGDVIVHLDRLRQGQPHATESTAEDDADSDDFDAAQTLQHIRLDFASAVNYRDAIWQFLAPAGITVGAILTVLGIWLPWYLYPPILLLGVLVGALNHYRVRRSEAKRLDSLRAQTDREPWSMLSVLVKKAETPDTTAYYAWISGRQYAATDREEFSGLFRAYATRPPRYELPDPDVPEHPPHPLEARDADAIDVSAHNVASGS